MESSCEYTEEKEEEDKTSALVLSSLYLLDAVNN
jgi:hypothetical protein